MQPFKTQSIALKIVALHDIGNRYVTQDDMDHIFMAFSTSPHSKCISVLIRRDFSKYSININLKMVEFWWSMLSMEIELSLFVTFMIGWFLAVTKWMSMYSESYDNVIFTGEFNCNFTHKNAKSTMTIIDLVQYCNMNILMLIAFNSFTRK